MIHVETTRPAKNILALGHLTARVNTSPSGRGGFVLRSKSSAVDALECSGGLNTGPSGRGSNMLY